MELAPHDPFDDAYETLFAKSTDRNRILFEVALHRCVENYATDNHDLLEKQVQRVADAVWNNPKLAISSICSTFLAPYIHQPSRLKPTLSFVDHPSVIRTYLVTAKLLDDHGGVMDNDEREEHKAFILSLPNIEAPHDKAAPLLQRTGVALLGEAWTAVQTLYSLQVDGMIKFRQVLYEIPSDILRQSRRSIDINVHIPDSLIP